VSSLQSTVGNAMPGMLLESGAAPDTSSGNHVFWCWGILTRLVDTLLASQVTRTVVLHDAWSLDENNRLILVGNPRSTPKLRQKRLRWQLQWPWQCALPRVYRQLCWLRLYSDRHDVRHVQIRPPAPGFILLNGQQDPIRAATRMDVTASSAYRSPTPSVPITSLAARAQRPRTRVAHDRAAISTVVLATSPRKLRTHPARRT
jgi:hypothetical protein